MDVSELLEPGVATLHPVQGSSADLPLPSTWYSPCGWKHIHRAVAELQQPVDPHWPAGGYQHAARSALADELCAGTSIGLLHALVAVVWH